MLHTRMDKGRKHIKRQQLYGGTAILSAATLRGEHSMPGPLTGKSWMSSFCRALKAIRENT